MKIFLILLATVATYGCGKSQTEISKQKTKNTSAVNSISTADANSDPEEVVHDVTVTEIDSIPRVDPTPDEPEVTPVFFQTKSFQPGTARVRRLTNRQIVGSLNSLFGTQYPADKLGRDPSVNGFSNNAKVLNFNSLTQVESLQNLIRDSFRQAITKKTPRAFIGCSSSSKVMCANACNCIRNFVNDFGKKAYRRAVDPAEADDLVRLFQQIRPTNDLPKSLEFLVVAMLSNTQFLFQSEVGSLAEASEEKNMTDAEIIATLSLTAADKPPEANEIDNAKTLVRDTIQLRNIAHRHLRSPEGKQVLLRFIKEWFGLTEIVSMDKDSTAFPEFSPVLAQSMDSEIDHFIFREMEKNVFSIDGLLLSRESLIDGPLATLYGIQISEAEELVQLDTNRQGLLTKAGFLAALAGTEETVPTKRGEFILSSLTCVAPPGVPAGVEIGMVEVTGATKREKFEQHSADATCKGCHNLLDPFGFGLENFDALGKFRIKENGGTIDPSGSTSFLKFTKEDYGGPAEMIQILAKAPEVKACLVRQAFRFLHGRAEVPDDGPLLQAGYAALLTSDGDIRQLFAELLTNPMSHKRR